MHRATIFASLRHARRTRAGALLAALACPVACQDAGRAGESATAETAPPAPLPLDLRTDGPWPPPFDSSPLWQRAGHGDDLDLARLAGAEGAAGLMSAVELGGSLGSTALSALAFAEDRAASRGRLCELIAGTDPATRDVLIRALHQAVTTGPRDEETLDPEGDRRCLASLASLADASDLDPGVRDRLQSTRLALGGR